MSRSVTSGTRTAAFGSPPSAIVPFWRAKDVTASFSTATAFRGRLRRGASPAGAIRPVRYRQPRAACARFDRACVGAVRSAGTMGARDLAKLRAQSKINRLAPLLPLPAGPLRRLRSGAWRGARACNLAVWRSDSTASMASMPRFAAGREDSDF